MRRVVVLALLALALPIAAWADTIDITNRYGSVSLSSAGISANSQMGSYNNILVSKGHALGYVNFGTGAFSGSSLKGNGTFSSAGSWFDITGRGQSGEPKGTIFSGAFVGPIDWTLTSPPGNGGKLTFTLTGDVRGMLYNGHEASGTTTQYFYSTNYQLSKGLLHLSSGNTHLSASPEPGTLGLLGTGLVGIAGVFRRRKKA